jgi:CheY-like chemotaxis protein
METLKILLVEDHREWQKILQEKISRALQGIAAISDIQVVVVSQFDEAWECLKKEDSWHLLVTDIGLSEPDSRQKLGKYLVELACNLHIPTIVVSGTEILTKQEVSDLLTDNNYKARAFFSKQEFDGKKFVEKIQESLQKENIKLFTNPNLSNK